jgi:peptidoglycan/xylan/chitin deacetylase (PgdA/CDA1 family)
LDSILTTLQRNQISSEFYVIGTEVASSPEKAKLIVKQGHRIQNHSWSHINLAKATESEVRSQLEKTQKAIREATAFLQQMKAWGFGFARP